MKCRECTNLHLIKECKNLLWCEDVLDAPDPDAERECQYFKRATNADRIRAMTDEELARWMEQYERCVEHKRKCDSKCYQCWLDWLKQEVEE